MNRGRVNFGHDLVNPDEKTRRVESVFRTVAERYDIMNDVMSIGLHRIFKRIAIETTSLRPRSKVLDVAAGTGDLCALLADVIPGEIRAQVRRHSIHTVRGRSVEESCRCTGEVR